MRQDKARTYKTIQYMTIQENTRHDKRTRYTTRQDNLRQYKAL